MQGQKASCRQRVPPELGDLLQEIAKEVSEGDSWLLLATRGEIYIEQRAVKQKKPRQELRDTQSLQMAQMSLLGHGFQAKIKEKTEEGLSLRDLWAFT